MHIASTSQYIFTPIPAVRDEKAGVVQFLGTKQPLVVHAVSKGWGWWAKLRGKAFTQIIKDPSSLKNETVYLIAQEAMARLKRLPGEGCQGLGREHAAFVKGPIQMLGSRDRLSFNLSIERLRLLGFRIPKVMSSSPLQTADFMEKLSVYNAVPTLLTIPKDISFDEAQFLQAFRGMLPQVKPKASFSVWKGMPVLREYDFDNTCKAMRLEESLVTDREKVESILSDCCRQWGGKNILLQEESLAKVLLSMHLAQIVEVSEKDAYKELEDAQQQLDQERPLIVGKEEYAQVGDIKLDERIRCVLMKKILRRGGSFAVQLADSYVMVDGISADLQEITIRDVFLKKMFGISEKSFFALKPTTIIRPKEFSPSVLI